MSLRSGFGLRIPQISIQPSVDYGLCPSMGRGYTGSKRPTNSGDVCRISACPGLKAYNRVNNLHRKHKKKSPYLTYILAVMQLVCSLELSLSIYWTLISAIIFSMEAVKWSHHLATAVHRHAKT